MNQRSPIESTTNKAATLSKCGKMRWNLRRWWHEDSRVCWVMLNPSTADAEIDDPTLKRCMHFSKAWGYGGLIITNLYPYRSPSPPECRRWAARDHKYSDLLVRKQLIRNQKEVLAACQTSDIIVAAWGNQPWAAKWSVHMLTQIQKNTDKPIYCLGTTQNGNPKHPMARARHRVPNDQQPLIWRDV